MTTTHDDFTVAFQRFQDAHDLARSVREQEANPKNLPNVPPPVSNKYPYTLSSTHNHGMPTQFVNNAE